MQKKANLKIRMQERLQMFTSGNRGGRTTIAAEDMTLVENNLFENMVYDPIGKRNDLLISVENFTHTVAVQT